VTIVGIELGTLLGGSVITETIFAWPGVGSLSVQAIYNRDYPVVQAAVFLLASTFVLVNLFVDILYTYLDPPIRRRCRVDGRTTGRTLVADSDSGAARIALPTAHAARVGRREWFAFWRRLARRRTAVFGAVVVAAVLGVALAAPLISPFDPL